MIIDNLNQQTSIASLISPITENIMENVRGLNGISGTKVTAPRNVTIPERLFNSTADAKIEFSKFAVYFTKELKDKLFYQLDMIHDPDGWEDDEQPITVKSLSTFLRWSFVTKPNNYPNFGLSNEGHLIASWLANDNADKLILEFLGNDSIRWFVEKKFDNVREYSSGNTKLERIQVVLQPYDLDIWFD